MFRADSAGQDQTAIRAGEPLARALGRLLKAFAEGPLPAEALAAARSRLFHAFGLSLAGARLPASEAAWRAVAGSAGPATVFGRGQRLRDEDAAFVNGVTGHGSLLEDCGPGGLREGSHPGTYIIPAALAAAESADASGARFVAGVVAGYEAVSRLGAAAPASIVARKFRPVGVMGPIGAAAAAAAAFGADEAQFGAALAIAANLSGGSTQGIFEGTMEPYFQAGFGARNGLFAARLAMAGAATAAEALEGEFGFFQTYGGEAGEAATLLGPRARPGVCAVGTKRFAACLQNQQTLALIVDGVETPVDAASVRRVVIRRPEGGTNGLNSPGVSRSAPFANMLSAQMSARFTAAAALLGHAVDDPAFYDRSFADAAIVALADRIELVPHASEGVVVEIDFADGRSLVLDESKADVLHPPPETVRARFLLRAGPVIGARAAAAAELIDAIETLPRIRTLTDRFTA